MDQRIMLTKRLIKENLLMLLEKDTIYQITVKELCQHAQINRSTFYSHYNSPRDVLLEIEQDAAKDISKMKPCKTKEELKGHLTSVCNYLYENRKVQKIIMKNNTDEEMAKTMTDGTFIFDIPSVYLGNTKQTEPENIELLMTFITHGLYSVLKKWIMEDLNKTPEEIANLMADMILRQI